MIFNDCKVGAWDIYRVELFWIIRGAFRLIDPDKMSFHKSYFVTRLGKFHVNPSANGTYIVSPAFERPDIDRLLQLIKTDLKLKKKVLFIDVGAYFGTYSIGVGNACRKFAKNLDIIAFEPEASNFGDKNVAMMKKNLKANDIKNVKIYKIGLGKANETKPNKYGIILKKFDSIIKPDIAKKYDSIFIKIDIEGGETDALRGSVKFIANASKLTLLVEDYIDPKIVSYLSNRFSFMDKITPHNSFWISK